MQHPDYMARALELARRAVGRVSPNPPVGAIVVKSERIVGEGVTQPPGGPHAEVMALRQAGEQAHGATIYVTLEPCAFHGRTPPCSGALIDAGIVEVHIATIDLHPRVNGHGLAELEAAGIRVILGEHEEEARELSEPFFKWATSGYPLVIAKYAMTLDGKISTVTGDSRWVTGEPARARVHEIRHQVDAVLVGIGTVLADDPALTARIGDSPTDRQPLRVVLDSHCRLPTSCRLAGPGLARGTLLITTPNRDATRATELMGMGMEVVAVEADCDGRVDVDAAMSHLRERGITSVLVEGGGTILASLLGAGLVDKVMAFVAPRIVGGAGAPTPVEGEGIGFMSNAINLRRVRVEQIGDDTLITGYVGNWGCQRSEIVSADLSSTVR